MRCLEQMRLNQLKGDNRYEYGDFVVQNRFQEAAFTAGWPHPLHVNNTKKHKIRAFARV